MAGYGPQNEEYYAKQKADFESKHPPGEKRAKLSGPRRLVGRAGNTRPTNNGGEVIVEEVEVPVSSGGGQGRQYITPNYQHHVFMALSLTFILVLLSAYGRGKSSPDKQVNQYLDPHTDPVKFSVGWLGLTIVLLSAASFRGTDKLAAAFAWLIFVAVLLVNGEQALSVFSGALGRSSTVELNPNYQGGH